MSVNPNLLSSRLRDKDILDDIRLSIELRRRSINRTFWRSCVWLVLGTATVLVGVGLWGMR